MLRCVLVLVFVWSLAEARRAECGCQCSQLTLRDNFGRVSGNCKSSWQGARWCYVDSWTKPCGDLKQSTRSSKPWSYKACRIKSSRQCDVRPPPQPRPPQPRPPVSKPQTDFNHDKEIPFTELKCRADEEHLPDDPFCCRRIKEPGFVYCT